MTEQIDRMLLEGAKMHEKNKKMAENGEGAKGESANPGMRVSEMLSKDNPYEKEKMKQQYNAYVKEITPKKNLLLQMLKAFVTGGTFCVLGQMILNYCEELGLDKDTAGSWSALLLILLSVILTSFSLYQYIAAWGGAGALVPITGFANSVCSPALEYKPEGQVFGIGVKIFTIAGPVILYGIFTSALLGFFYWCGAVLI